MKISAKIMPVVRMRKRVRLGWDLRFLRLRCKMPLICILGSFEFEGEFFDGELIEAEEKGDG